jgi:hypothetical protein
MVMDGSKRSLLCSENAYIFATTESPKRAKRKHTYSNIQGHIANFMTHTLSLTLRRTTHAFSLRGQARRGLLIYPFQSKRLK